MSTFRDQQVEEAAQLARRMRVLKWVVSVLGILLVLAMITTVAGVIYKARHNAAAGGTAGNGQGATAAAGQAGGGFGTASLPIPPACQISSATASGDRLIIVTSGPADQCRLILVADLKSGRLVGQFTYPAP
ncbi:MAG TPA: hypothetical protein VM659_02285 [Dongiaceae bacterium]|nr:hypothetical protein [Dongiaceae bacterium]